MRRVALLCASVLVAAGLVVAPFASAPASAAELLRDGGFESASGNPVNSPNWTESDNWRGSPLCDTSLCESATSFAPPRSGSKWALFGGNSSRDHAASLSQSVVIPTGTATLSYWYRNGYVSSPYDATLRVRIDGTTLRTHTEVSRAQGSYSLQTISLPSSFANGRSHSISFAYDNGGDGLNVMTVDDVSLNHNSPPPTTARPTVSSTVPASAGTTTSPKVKGTAESGSTVVLYANSSCSGPSIGTGPAADFAGTGITANVPANTTTTIFAKATKGGQIDSACSTSSATYTHNTAPAPVVLTGVSPTSPDPSTRPTLRGTAPAGSTVRLYTTANCSGAAVATGSAAQLSSPGLTATVVLGSTTTFRATATDAAGNVSSCSTTALGYTADLVDGGFEAASGDPADSPSWTEADTLAGSPLCTVDTCADPAGETAPRTGRALVWFGGFETAGHAGALSQRVVLPATGTASLGFWFKNISVSPPYDARLRVQVDGTTVRTVAESTADETAWTRHVVGLSAYADGGAHTITFSYSNGEAGVTNMLVDDIGLGVQPAVRADTPTVTGVSPSSASTTPRVTGTAEAGSTVELYGSASCSGQPLVSGSAADFAGGGIAAAVPAGSSTTFHARVFKAGEDDSACSTTSATYRHLVAPDTAFTKTPGAKVKTRKRKAKVAFAFSSPTPGATFECSVDGKAYVACVSGRKVKLKPGKHTFAVRAVAAGLTDPTPATWAVKVKRKRR